MAHGTLDIRPLTADTWPDLAALFEEGGDPKWCWCQFYRVRGLDWSNSSADGNRERLTTLTRDGPPPGLVGYQDRRAVGWVSVAPRPAYDRLTHAKLLAPVDDKPVWSIVCFVVSRVARGQGLTTRLLDAAMDYAVEHGAPALEAYPVAVGDGRIPAAVGYTGLLSTFLAAGFEVVHEIDSPQATVQRVIVRRTVDP